MMKRFFLFSFFPILAITVLFSALPLTTKAQVPQQTTKLKKSKVRIPMLTMENLPYVKVRFGKSPKSYRFLLDTGASITMLNEWFVEKEDKRIITSKFKAHAVDAFGKKVPGHPCLIPEMRLGKGLAVFKNVKALQKIGSKMPIHPKNKVVAGILSYTVFKDCLLTIDYPVQRIILRKGTLAPANNRTIFPMPRISHPTAPSLLLSFNEKAIPTMLDSGLSSGCSIPLQLLSQVYPEYAKLPARETFVRTVGGKRKGTVLSFRPVLEAGSYQFKPSYTAIAQGSKGNNEMTIGTETFKDYVLTFSQQQRLVRITKPERQ